MGYLIDTNIAIHARDGLDQVLENLIRYDGSIFLSALSLAELHRGFYSPSDPTGLRRRRLEQLLTGIAVLPFDAAAARAYGDIIANMGWSRSRDLDRLIAGHAIATRNILVTANVPDFAGVPGLVIENWLTHS